jgi:hypothetical protein
MGDAYFLDEVTVAVSGALYRLRFALGEGRPVKHTLMLHRARCRWSRCKEGTQLDLVTAEKMANRGILRSGPSAPMGSKLLILTELPYRERTPRKHCG